MGDAPRSWTESGILAAHNGDQSDDLHRADQRPCIRVQGYTVESAYGSYEAGTIWKDAETDIPERGEPFPGLQPFYHFAVCRLIKLSIQAVTDASCD
jgi:hypothetical protein